METIKLAFQADNLEFHAVVKVSAHSRRFEIDMSPDYPYPITLERYAAGQWKLENQGQQIFPDSWSTSIENAIDEYLYKIYALQNILVLTDLSLSSLNAARYAAAFADRINARNIIIYHSTSVPLATDIPLDNSSVEDADEQEVLNKLSQLKEEIKQLVSTEVTVDFRKDDRMLLSAVNMLSGQHQLGLVVMGITGKSNLKEILIGSNTITIARESKIPVLIVPDEAQFQEIRCVVFACDLKKVSDSVPVEAVRTLISALGAQLLILDVAQHQAQGHPDRIKDLEALNTMWGNKQPEYHYLVHEDQVAGIMDFSVQQNAQLLLTVPKQYGFLEGLFQRDLSEKLAYHTHLPLLLLREDK